MARMPLGAYARARGVAESAIRHQVRRGLIKRAADGTVDSGQADTAWFVHHRARRAGEARTSNADYRLVLAKLAATRAKIALLRHQTEALAGDVAEAAAVRAAVAGEVRTLLTAIDRMTADPGQLALSRRKAAALVARFRSLTLAELPELATLAQP